MRKLIIMVMTIASVITLSACDGITQEEATIILEETLEQLQGSKTTVFEARDPYIDKLIVLHYEEYFDTVILDYNGSYDYRYQRYVEARLNDNDEQLYYPVYFECTTSPNCDSSNVPTQSQLNTIDEQELFLQGERNYYVYLKGQDMYFDFYQFIDVASGVITYAVKDAEDNVVLSNIQNTTSTEMLLNEEITVETYTFDITVNLEELRLNEPEILKALYFLNDVSTYDLTEVYQVITLEVNRETNELVSFFIDQNFSNVDSTVSLPDFARDYQFEIILFKNGQEAIDYIASEPTLIPNEVTVQ